MLSYLHSFHAGNRADVHKHRALAKLITHLTQKPRGLTYMESHAGRGLYDLASEAAEKTGEARIGIAALAPLLPKDDPLLPVLNDIRRQFGDTAYPGSPKIAQALFRKTDQLQLVELHPKEGPALKRLVKGDNVHIHMRDGFEAMLALAPPTPRRGLVLIDPPYEVKEEYQRVAETIPLLLKKWPETIILLWYPILDAGRHEPMLQHLNTSGISMDLDEWRFTHGDAPSRMRGSGLALVNPPYGFEWPQPLT